MSQELSQRRYTDLADYIFPDIANSLQTANKLKEKELVLKEKEIELLEEILNTLKNEESTN